MGGHHGGRNISTTKYAATITGHRAGCVGLVAACMREKEYMSEETTHTRRFLSTSSSRPPPSLDLTFITSIAASSWARRSVHIQSGLRESWWESRWCCWSVHGPHRALGSTAAPAALAGCSECIQSHPSTLHTHHGRHCALGPTTGRGQCERRRVPRVRGG